MSGHTEGPLVVKRAENLSDGAYDYAIIAKVNGEDQIIGETFGRSDWSVYLPAEENANLFAAAPTLLAERDEARRERDALLEAVAGDQVPTLWRITWLEALLAEIDDGSFGRIGEDEDPDATTEMISEIKLMVDMLKPAIAAQSSKEDGE